MVAPLKQKKGESYNYEPHQLICFQVNLQHSRAATANLMQMISTDNIGMSLIQEPYLYQNKLAGITKGYRTYAYREGKCRAAIIIQDNTIDALLITQMSDNDAVLLEISKGKSSFYAASIYFNIEEPIANNIRTVDRILDFTKGKLLLLAMDSNSRSTTWHDVLTNYRGKEMEEFLAYNQLYIINEGSERTTFQSSRGSSNIDLTIVNNHMLAVIEDWEILEEESCSDHNIIKYKLHFNPNRTHAYNFQGPRFIAREHQFADFHNNLRQQIIKNFQLDNNGGNTTETDKRLVESLTSKEDVGRFIEKIDDTIRTTCTETFRYLTSPKKLCNREISPLVVDNSYYNEEKN